MSSSNAELEHSTDQAHEQPHDIPKGPAEGEDPKDLKSRPNDARNDHQASESGLNDVEYPPQLHAGKVGLGPHYAEQNRPTLSEQVDGLKEQLKGKLKHDPNMVEHGHERVTGELKRKEHEKEHEFSKPTDGAPGAATDDKPQEGTATTAGSGDNAASKSTPSGQQEKKE